MFDKANVFVAAVILVILTISHSHRGVAEAGEDEDELVRLQGTWKVVQFQNVYRTSVDERERYWVFAGPRLYRNVSAPLEGSYEVKVDAESDPKVLELYLRRLAEPRRDLPECAIYKFDGERLIVATSRTKGKRPDAFIPGDAEDDSNVVNIIWTLERADKPVEIPEAMQKAFDDIETLRPKNREAEVALVKFLNLFLKRAPLEEIQPLVAEGKAKQLIDVVANDLPFPPGKMDETLKVMTVRDAFIGEKLRGPGGHWMLIKKDHFREDTALLVLQGNSIQARFFLRKEDDGWKVDVTELIQAKQSKRFEIIRRNPDRDGSRRCRKVAQRLSTTTRDPVDPDQEVRQRIECGLDAGRRSHSSHFQIHRRQIVGI